MVDSVEVDRSCLFNDDGKIFRSLLLLLLRLLLWLLFMLMTVLMCACITLIGVGDQTFIQRRYGRSSLFSDLVHKVQNNPVSVYCGANQLVDSRYLNTSRSVTAWKEWERSTASIISGRSW